MSDESGPPADQSRDALTGVLRWNQRSRIGPDSTLVMLDLDKFAQLNYRLGHQLVDRVLRVVAQRLQDELAPYLVLRSGGDEFVIEVSDPLDDDELAVLVAKIHRKLAEPTVDDIIVSAGIGIGIAGGADFERRLTDADHACFDSKALKVAAVIYPDRRYLDDNGSWRDLLEAGDND